MKIINRITNEVIDRQGPDVSFISDSETAVFQPNVNEYPWMFQRWITKYLPPKYIKDDGGYIWFYSKDKPKLFYPKEGIADCMAWSGHSKEEIDEFMKNGKPVYLEIN